MNGPLSMLDVIRGGAHKPRENAPCPFCGHAPTEMARKCGPVYLVGCDNDSCYDNGICAQASGKTPEAAWRAWNTRAPSLRVVSSNPDPITQSELEAAATGGMK